MICGRNNLKNYVPAKPRELRLYFFFFFYYFLFIFCWFLHIMNFLNMNFQVYLMYILGDTDNQSSNFSIFLTFSSFFKVWNSRMTPQISFLHVNLKCFTEGVHLTLPLHVFSVQVMFGACYITGQWVASSE